MNKNSKQIISRRLHWLRKIKTSRGCENCGYNENPLALDFAHINPSDKHFVSVLASGGNGISKLYRRISKKNKSKQSLYIKELFQEIRKCKILCKNCHVIETHKNNEFDSSKILKERGSYKDRLRYLKTGETTSSLESFFS